MKYLMTSLKVANFNQLNNAARDAQIATNDALTELEANQKVGDDVTREALDHII